MLRQTKSQRTLSDMSASVCTTPVRHKILADRLAGLQQRKGSISPAAAQHLGDYPERMDFYRKQVMPNHQYSLSLISHTVDKSVIEQRASDGYINATAMCKAAGKQMNDYTRLDTTKAFLQELSSDTGIPVSQLIQVLKEGWKGQGTWAHPQVSTHLAQWLSPKFAVQVSKWVHEWLSGKRTSGAHNLPYHLRRHMLNINKVPSHSHFSILQEMTNTLIAPLEANGYTMPEKLMPDISQGRMFCKFARDQLGIDTDALPTYTHDFEGRISVEAKLYPLEHLSAFRKYIGEVWMPERAAGYFKEKDPSALPMLDKVLQLTYRPKKAA
jgi:hypothetical protein